MTQITRELFASLPRWSYGGSPANPYPPTDSGWRDVAWENAPARAAAASLLGALPVSEYTDIVLPSGGLYRFFAFETAMGAKSIGALEYVGDGAATLGADPNINASLSQAQSDLNAQSAGVAQIAASYINTSTPDYTSAVSSIQAIGNAAVSSTGIAGEIDGAGFASITQPLTQQAWTLNQTLSAIDPSSAGQAEANHAQTQINAMFALYQQAINAAQNANAGGGGGGPGQVTLPVTNVPGSAAQGQTLDAATNALLANLQANGCQPKYVQAVYDFQVAAGGIGTDGLYGKDTADALQSVLDALGQGGQAPPPCVGAAPSGGGGGGGGVTPSGGGGGGTTPAATTSGTSWASVAALGGGIITIAGIVIAAATGYIPNPFK